MRSDADLHQDYIEGRADEWTEPGTWNDLDEHLTGDLPDIVEDHATAERMLRSIARRRRDLARSEALAQAQTDQVALWLDGERKRLSTEFYEQQLAAYHRSLMAQDDRLKTVSLPSGRLKARAGQPRWEIDPDAFLAWAQSEAPHLVRTKIEPDRSEAKKVLSVVDGKAMTEAGEVVPGVVIEPAEVRYTIEVES